MSLDNIIDNVL
jgi:hypothetical protein